MPGSARLLPAAARFDARLRASRRAVWLVGVDEAGRGPLAGPVVVAAVRLGAEIPAELFSVRDSKLLSPSRREDLYEKIRARAAAVAVAWSLPREIDRINILQATLTAMRRAVLRASQGVDPVDSMLVVVVDGNRPIPSLPLEQIMVVGGDRLSLAVGAASIVAKVTRDRWMRRLDLRYPGYGLARHKGYGTAGHLEALQRLGPSAAHRRTFQPVRQMSLS